MNIKEIFSLPCRKGLEVALFTWKVKLESFTLCSNTFKKKKNWNSLCKKKQLVVRKQIDRRCQDIYIYIKKLATNRNGEGDMETVFQVSCQ